MLLPSPDHLGADLPVREVLPSLTAALSVDGAAVLTAPPGSGKTSLAPLALADHVGGKVVVAEPRRVAARAAARRMAELTGTTVGDEVGYTVRADSKTSSRTRVEVVTTGVLVQRLQRDPELPGVDALMLDECHERHLDTDLALAFAVDVRANLRDDLWLLAASATAQAERLAVAMGRAGSSAAQLTAAAKPHPLEVVWAPPARPVAPPHGLRVDPKLLDHVAEVVRTALREREGDVLAFLPGVGEAEQVAKRLRGLNDVEVSTLHGRQRSQRQDAALRAGERRRVVLSTAVAESSVTVPGVRIVVDAGLSREPRTDHSRGLDALTTTRVSRAAARQRAGRAARQAPGTVYRCWSEAEHERLPAHAAAEISVADLTGFALQLARWGSVDGGDLALLDAPPQAAHAAAVHTLTALGAVDPAGAVTARGEAMARIGAHPRLARALLDAVEVTGVRKAAETVALLGSDARMDGDDLPAELRRLRADSGSVGEQWRRECARLTSLAAAGGHDRIEPAAAPSDDAAAAYVAALAFPERLARARRVGGDRYLTVGGTEATLPPGSRLSGVEWLAVAEADRQPGAAHARIRLAAPADAETACAAAASLRRSRSEIDWVDGDVVAREVDQLGAVVLGERPLHDPDPEAVLAALCEGLRREGLGLLRWDADAVALRQRLAFCRGVFGPPWPLTDETSLTSRAMEWLGPELAAARRRADLARTDVATALRRLLPPQQAGQLPRLAPERLEVPSGSKRRVDYSDPKAPVLAAQVQECFGWTATPRIADGRVPVVVHLLSPAGRPAAITSDLESFWRQGYPQVRAELRGRYPKHDWPQDPAAAVPRRRPRR